MIHDAPEPMLIKVLCLYEMVHQSVYGPRYENGSKMIQVVRRRDIMQEFQFQMKQLARAECLPLSTRFEMTMFLPESDLA